MALFRIVPIKHFLLIILLIFVGNSVLFGQVDTTLLFNRADLAFDISAAYGTMVKHTPKMNHIDNKPDLAFEIDIFKHADVDAYWSQALGIPDLGVTILYNGFGEPDILGRGFGIYPFMGMYLLRAKKFSIRFKSGAGFSYITEPYDINDNPDNNVIGTSINNIIHLGLNFTYQITDHLHIYNAMSITHHSNASYQTPNLGINFVTASLGVQYQADKIRSVERKYKTEGFKHAGDLRARIGIGVKENQITGGPKYPIYNFSIAYARMYTPAHRWRAGLFIEYNTLISDFIQNNSIIVDNPQLASTKVALEVGDEFIINHTGLTVQIGYYLHNSFLKQGNVLTRYGIQQYFLNHKLFIGLYMKSHYFRADYAEFGIGYKLG